MTSLQEDEDEFIKHIREVVIEEYGCSTEAIRLFREDLKWMRNLKQTSDKSKAILFMVILSAIGAAFVSAMFAFVNHGIQQNVIKHSSDSSTRN